MAYEPTNWKTGDVVTSAKLNKMEQGIAESGTFIANYVYGDSTTLDKTMGEIREAINSGMNVVVTSDDSFDDPQYGYTSISRYQIMSYKETVPTGSESEDVSTYEIEFNSGGSVRVFAASALNEYPTLQD